MRNLENLASALDEMGALIYASEVDHGLKWARDAAQLARGEIWNLITPFGRFDIAFSPSGTKGYRDLAADADTFNFEGIEIPVASLRDVIRSKEAANRDRDRSQLPTLRKLLARLQKK